MAAEDAPENLDTAELKPSEIKDLKELKAADIKASDINVEDLKASADAAQKALNAHGMAQKLKDAASSITDPEKRNKLLREAYDKEIEAHGNSKKARMLTSGAFQGAIAGAGIGTAVGAGVGTVVGTLVTGVTAIPSAGLGALAGSGIGAFHGPWIKLPPIMGGKNGEKKKKEEEKEGQEDEDEEEEKDEEDSVPDPEVLRKAAEALEEERAKQDKADGGKKAKGKPRKIEIRTKQQPEKKINARKKKINQ